MLDTVMLNYFAGIQKEMPGTADLNKAYQGIIIEDPERQEYSLMH
jgi:hypothetical protein